MLNNLLIPQSNIIKNHNNVLDGIRGLAVLLVIASHTNGLNLYGQGGIGVWLFFVLSGFLLTTPFAKEPSVTPSIKYIIKYFVKRILRILPMYYFTLSALLLLKLINISTYKQHLLFIKADGHLWSVPQELVFYLVLPLIIFINYKIFKNNRYVIFTFLIITAYVTFKYPPAFTLHGRPLYIYIFILGIATSYIFHQIVIILDKKPLPTISKIANIIGIIITLVLVFSAKFYVNTFSTILLNKKVLNEANDRGFLGWEYQWIFAILSCLLILCTLLSKDGLLTKIFSLKILRTIGIVGYSMYLIHYFLIPRFNQIGIVSGNLQFFLVLIITFILSHITYRFIEHPFMVLSKKPISRHQTSNEICN